MRDAIAAAIVSILVTLGSIIASADMIVNRQTLYAVVFGVGR